MLQVHLRSFLVLWLLVLPWSFVQTLQWCASSEALSTQPRVEGANSCCGCLFQPRFASRDRLESWR